MGGDRKPEAANGSAVAREKSAKVSQTETAKDLEQLVESLWKGQGQPQQVNGGTAEDASNSMK
jgi:hypothetical protein